MKEMLVMTVVLAIVIFIAQFLANAISKKSPVSPEEQ